MAHPTHDLRQLPPFAKQGDRVTKTWTTGFLIASWLVGLPVIWFGLDQPIQPALVLLIGTLTTLYFILTLLFVPRRIYETNWFFWFSSAIGFIAVFLINRYSGGLESPFFILYWVGLLFVATYVHPNTVTVFAIFYMAMVVVQAVTDPDGLQFSRTHLSLIFLQIGFAMFLLFNQISMAIRILKEQGQRELAERLAKDNQQLYEESNTLLKHMSDGVIAFDEQGKILTMNRQAGLLTNVSSSIAKGQSYTKVFIRPPSFLSLAFKKKVSTQVDETIWITQSGSQKVIEGSITPVSVGVKTLYLLVFRDITEKKALEQAKEEYLITTSHQLNTPLAKIRIGAGLIAETRLSRAQKKGLFGIKAGLERLSQLIKDLLDISTLKDPHEIVNRAPIALTDIINQVVDKVKPMAHAAQITVKVEVPKPPSLVDGDEPRLMQALFNIVDNAIRYNQPSGRVDIAVAQRKKAIEISVSDTGRGIEKQYLSKIFDPFFRIEEPHGGIMQIGTQGTGMGLYIASKIIEAQGGWIKVESQVGKGSVFTVLLPLSSSQKTVQIN